MITIIIINTAVHVLMLEKVHTDDEDHDLKSIDWNTSHMGILIESHLLGNVCVFLSSE